MVGDVLWFGPLKSIQKLFFHTPLVNMFVFGSEFYHDYYRWPKKDQQVFEEWKRARIGASSSTPTARARAIASRARRKLRPRPRRPASDARRISD